MAFGLAVRAVPALLLVVSAAAAASPAGGRFAPCPSAPHCVNSRAAGERHGIAPFVLVGNDPAAWARLVATVRAMPRTTLVESGDHYVHAEVVSPWHIYTDDLELLWDPATARVDVRSSSRVGYYDFGVNRDRVEDLRRRLVETGIVE